MNQFNLNQKVKNLVLLFLFFSSVSIFSQEGNADNGKKLFKANCAACHKLDKKLVGPPLKGVTERHDRDWLHAWIKDNVALRKSGDKDAIAIFEEYNKMPMIAYPQFSKQEIDDILAYTDGKESAKKEVAGTQKVDPLVEKGKKLYKANCAACHKMDKKLVGPPLKGVTERRDRDWLHAWIKDNAAFRKSGDKDAIAIFEEYNKMPMTAFPQLSDEDIDAMLAYFKVGDVKKVVAGQTEVVKEEKSSNAWMSYIAAIVILVLLLWMLLFSKNGFLKITSIIAIVLLVTYVLFDWLSGIGIDQGYQPVQPIAFSHKVHAGDNKIDCQYCHSSAKHSKVSGVPTANVCMNCHKNIAEYSGNGNETEKQIAFYNKEIQKIYDAVGWDPEKFQYIEGYEQKPIIWNRVHNLPDFAYYNHSQHVTVAGIACQKCHGPVEEMEEMYQFSPLTMGWCIDCHKESNVDMDNEYYTKIHDELAKKYDLDKVSIAELGGKECGKCHY